MMIAKVTYEWTMIYSLLPDRELSNVTAQSTLHLLSTLSWLIGKMFSYVGITLVVSLSSFLIHYYSTIEEYMVGNVAMHHIYNSFYSAMKVNVI
jgi:hypothetical protein